MTPEDRIVNYPSFAEVIEKVCALETAYVEILYSEQDIVGVEEVVWRVPSKKTVVAVDEQSTSVTTVEMPSEFG